MSHLSVEACTQQLAEGHGDGYRLAALEGPAVRRASTSLSTLRRHPKTEVFQSAQCLPFCTSVAGPCLWNSLPVALRDRDISLAQFKRLLKTLWFV